MQASIPTVPVVHSNQNVEVKPPTNRDASSDDVIDSPLFNYHSTERHSSADVDSPCPQFIIDECDPSLPPPSTESPYEIRTTRRSVISAVDMEELKESDFADTGKDFTKSAKDIDKIVRNIRTVVLFEGYDVEELQLVASYMYNRQVESGDVVIEYGGPGDAFYVVNRGQFKCTVPTSNGPQITVRTYDGDGYFGELALINHAPRAANIIAQTSGSLWVLDALRNGWLRKQRAIINAERFEQVIKAIPLFRDNLGPSLTNRLIDAIEVITLRAGEVICRQGDPGDAMYFIMDGEVDVFIDSDRVKRMHQNEFFGERALVLDEGRAATCCAVGKLRLAKLPKESFCLVIPDSVIECMRDHIARCYSGSRNSTAPSIGAEVGAPAPSS